MASIRESTAAVSSLRPEDVLATEELNRRAPHTPRYPEENEAYRLLARCLACRPEEMLQALSDQALLLCQAGSSGVSVLEGQPDGATIFRWVALSGACASYIGGSTPRDFSPCGTCLDQNCPVLFSYPARCFTYFKELSFPIVEGLVLPLRSDEQVFGTIWVMSHDPDRRFDSEDVRVMTGLADFTAAALRMNDLVKELKQSVVDVNRSNSDLEHFAYLASHDLQEPLRTVRTYTQLLARRYKGRLDKEADIFLGYIEDGTVRMATLIRGLLTYARLTQARSAVAVDLNELFESTCRNCQALIEETGAQVTAGPLPKACGDADQLLHVFQNLVSNAIRYRSSQPPRIEVAAEEDGNMVQVSVKDNGIGIAPEHQPKIFGMFNRLSRSEGGAGIGLALCQRVVEIHGGRLWVESAAGEGSTFRFTLPRPMAD